jgi:hypothetical protein
VNPPFSGGCEDLAMNNRKNQTLSALALSNRLNLGTRSLAANAGVNHGDQIVCILHTPHDVMRDGTMWYVVSSIPKTRYAIPFSPGSFSEIKQRQFQCVTVAQRRLPADVQVESESRPAARADRLQPRTDDVDRKFPAIVPASWTATTPKSGPTERSDLKSSRKRGPKPAARRASKPAAAAMSASSGK